MHVRRKKTLFCWFLLTVQAVQMLFILFAYKHIQTTSTSGAQDDRQSLPEDQPGPEMILSRVDKDVLGLQRAKAEDQAAKKPTRANVKEPLMSSASRKASVTSHTVVYITRPSTSQCPNLLRPEKVRETFQFQQVDGKKETFVFSAFYDERDQLVRVIAVSQGMGRLPYVCHLWYDVTNGTTKPDLMITSATIETLGENHGRRLSAAYIHCPLPEEKAALIPYALSVTSRDCQSDVTPPTNVLHVMTSEGPNGHKVHNFTVCMKPVNMHYSRAHEVVEFIEISRMLGATRFQVYLISLQPNVLQVLRWYEAQGIVETIDWAIDKHMHLREWPPSDIPPEIHAFGQIASSNDCLYRNRHSSRYLVLADWDEILVPRKHGGWLQLIRSLDQGNAGRGASEYSFACLFFRKDFPARQEHFPGIELALKYHSNVLMVNQRERTPVPFPARAKYIADPEKIEVAGIHYVLKYRADGTPKSLRRLKLRQNIGCSYHYRDWGKPKEFASLGVRDDDMLRFKDALLTRLEEVWKHLPNVTLHIPLSVNGTIV